MRKSVVSQQWQLVGTALVVYTRSLRIVLQQPTPSKARKERASREGFGWELLKNDRRTQTRRNVFPDVPRHSTLHCQRLIYYSESFDTILREVLAVPCSPACVWLNVWALSDEEKKRGGFRSRPSTRNREVRASTLFSVVRGSTSSAEGWTGTMKPGGGCSVTVSSAVATCSQRVIVKREKGVGGWRGGASKSGRNYREGERGRCCETNTGRGGGRGREVRERQRTRNIER